MFQRSINKILRETASSFPITVLTGPRQSGKTTLLKSLFPDYYYVNLEAPDELLQAQQDPRGFLSRHNQHWIIDEAQNCPTLFSYIQEAVDSKQFNRRYILSGSQNFLLSEKVSQTLAGRTGILELLPLTHQEYLSHTELPKLNLWDYLYQGSYPRPYHEHLSINLWYQSYIQTYLERDVRSLVNIQNLSKFQLFLKLCAGRHGQLLNINALAQDCGVSHTTLSHWLSILEASYIIFRLQPYYRNFNKRLVKTPKLYFYDSAIVCNLLGIESANHLQVHSSRGAIFEGFILTEIIKKRMANGKKPELYFWRDQSGIEIDGIIEKGEILQAIEIKSGMTIANDFFDTLKKWQKISSEPGENCYLIYAGSKDYKRECITVLPWDKIEKLNI